MAFLKSKDIKSVYTESKKEAQTWREDYPAYERLANNDLMEGLDPNLPEVNDGSLSAALFKLPKRIVPKELSGTVKSIDRDETWLSDLANMQWQNVIIPHANLQAPFIRKWKDAVRKAAIYGSVPLITLQHDRDGVTITDFVVAQPQDVTLEEGKVSDYDSDVIFWDVYYSNLQWENMIETAKAEKKSNNEGSFNKWDIKAMQTILDGDYKQEREPTDTPRSQQGKDVKPKGIKVCIAFQRGVNAPFYMYHRETNSTIREWSNPDPTGDVPVHFLYCYQDFINPYGIGIVKLAGGTQNVLDYMRQAHVLATQIGIRPPIMIKGAEDSPGLDLDSMVYAQDAQWFTGGVEVDRMEMSNQVYQSLPANVSMYHASLQKLIPTGDTSIASGEGGDPTMSKTPAGVKLAAANLSVDDEDFKDNLYITYEAVAKSMINTHFANMEGTDLMKLSDDEREVLSRGGLEFPDDVNQLEIVWDTVRGQFDFTVDPEQDKTKDDADKLEGLTRVAELAAADPTFVQDLMAAGKKFNKGELMSEIIALTSDNDKIVTDISPDEAEQQTEMAAGQEEQEAPQPKVNYKDAPEDVKRQMEMADGYEPSAMVSPEQQKLDQQGMQTEAQLASDAEEQSELDEEQQVNVDAIMNEYGVDENTALTMLAAEAAGLPNEDIIAYVQQMTEQANV